MLARSEPRRRFVAVEEGIAAMFRAYPTLHGFTIKGDAEIVIECWPREAASSEFCEEIAQALVELVDGKPDAAKWLFGRTFARHLH